METQMIAMSFKLSHLDFLDFKIIRCLAALSMTKLQRLA